MLAHGLYTPCPHLSPWPPSLSLSLSFSLSLSLSLPLSLSLSLSPFAHKRDQTRQTWEPGQTVEIHDVWVLPGSPPPKPPEQRLASPPAPPEPPRNLNPVAAADDRRRTGSWGQSAARASAPRLASTARRSEASRGGTRGPRGTPWTRGRHRALAVWERRGRKVKK